MTSPHTDSVEKEPQLILGDCLEKMRDIPDGSIDAVICDPPYGTTACKWDTCIPFEPMWEQLKRITKKNGAIVLFGSQPFTSALVMSNPKMFKYEWVWEKHKPSNFALAKKQPMKYHENIMVFYQAQPTYNPQMIERKSERIKQGQDKDYVGISVNKGELNSLKTITRNFKKYDAETKLPSAVLKINSVQSNSQEKKDGFHPTQKPLALMEYLIKTYTNEGETVLDFTMGSGTTGIACQNLNRNFIGIELDETYYEIARTRLQANQQSS